MTPTVTVGIDGSRESRAAVDWAAREALSRDAELNLVQIRETGPYPYSPLMDDEVEREWGEETTREAATDLARRYPGLRTATHHYSGRPSKVLVSFSDRDNLLVLGSRGLGPVTGFLVGSVGLPTLAHARCPVVVVRNQEAEDDAPQQPQQRPVVLGVKLEESADELLSFAFRTAERWETALRVVHGWELPPAFGVRPIAAPPRLVEELVEEKTEAVRKLLLPWQEKFPRPTVSCQAPVGWPARTLLTASADASLVVVGRRNRRSRFGTHIGSVTHAVLHHAEPPVAVVPHD
ncbi:universal stress protein [Streptomyces sp. RKND-216]|uniref:universal stress protein n=1 Tax=Streptomyces sp. RKND-216 TaxID=2562581 RepID=UPI00109DA22B|nr:universal stress protein [Streptomyces sp. RKND-216]THA26748.1 universal stress protein [Streptomyces sp. RKND-216]